MCPSSVRGCRRTVRRAVYSSGGAIDVVYTPAAREHSGPVGGSAALVGPRPPPGGWVRGRWGSGRISARQGHRRCLYPGVREHTGPAGVAAGVRAGALERPGWGCGSGPLLSSRPARWSSGCVFARRGHRRCLYPAAREHARPAGRAWPPGFGPGLWSGRVGVAGRVLFSLRVQPGGRRAVCSPGGAIDVVYTPRPGTLRARPGGRGRRGSGRGSGAAGLGLWVGFSPLFVSGQIAGAAGARGCRRTVRRVVCSPGGAIDVVYTPRSREHAGRGNGAALGAGSRVGVVGCGVSGRLVRRRCRSGRCAGGTRGRGWTARWW